MTHRGNRRDKDYITHHRKKGEGTKRTDPSERDDHGKQKRQLDIFGVGRVVGWWAGEVTGMWWGCGVVGWWDGQ